MKRIETSLHPLKFISQVYMELITAPSIVSITSCSISELTGKAHSHIMRDIRVMLEDLELSETNFGSTYYDAQGKTRPMFILPKREALILSSGYNVKLRALIIDKLEAFEQNNKPTFSIPQTYSEALLLASKQAEQIEQQKEIIAIQAPKVDFYEAVTGSTDTIDIGTVAKVLNIDGYGRTRLFAFLRDKGILRANNEPYQTYCDRGYFRIIESKFSKPDGSTHVSLKTVVYQKGVDYIRKLVVGAQ